MTRRQVEVLEAYLVTGSYAAAAARLGISYPTVRNHMSDLRRRLGVENTAQATYVLVTSGDLVHNDILSSPMVPADHCTVASCVTERPARPVLLPTRPGIPTP